MDEFVSVAGPLFEHSPWIAQAAASFRPFQTVDEMHRALLGVVDASPREMKLALIHAHPDLAGKLAVSGNLTEQSTAEQRSARLDRLSPDQFARMSAFNADYKRRFGFPFIICVRDHTQDQIFEAFERRLTLSADEEMETALVQIGRIAWHRLNDLLPAE